MQYRRLGQTELNVSIIGFGASPLGDVFGPVDPAEGGRAVSHATTSKCFGASSDPRVHFGLGAHDRVELLEIRCPSGIVQTLSGLKADQILTVHEPNSSSRRK